jgi:predicted DCC family thiol-disulfide oxidoreductase YuxK
MNIQEYDNVIFFDGYCGLCNKSVDWIIQKDSEHKFRFSPLQGELKLRLEESGLHFPQSDSIIMVSKNKILEKSTAALRIAKELPFPWKLLSVFSIFPRVIRDYVYDYIARNRFKWFGKSETCRIPTPNEKSLFID